MPSLDSYRQTVGGTRGFVRSMHDAQIGDPLKAAAAIDQALAAEKTPLRLQLGEDAVEAVRAHAKVLLDDLERWQAVAVNTRIEGAPSRRSRCKSRGNGFQGSSPCSFRNRAYLQIYRSSRYPIAPE
ncbi:MAG: hypothetical protein ACJ8R9_01075 [Steroidobacteraceae bacterium]